MVLGGGVPAKRANTLLFLIESRTAHLVVRSRQAMELFLTQESAQQRELAFLEAFALGSEPPLRPTIRDLERYAPQWAPLVPENPRVQAALAHRLGEKYQFTYQTVPNIRMALDLDNAVVQQAYQRLYRQPLESIFAARTAPADRLRWAWASLAGWLENLPPFWTAYALTLTETVGVSILALPIAVAGIGPLAGVAILVVLGVVNMLTIAFIAEAVSRSGIIRYGTAYIGQVVDDYLGRVGSVFLTVGMFVFCFLALQAFYIGFATTLQGATDIPGPVWVALLFLVVLYFLKRETLSATVASALVVGAINISLVFLDYLRGADLTEAFLSDAFMMRIDLDEASLARAQLDGVTLTDATLRSADLTDANLSNANLRLADLRGADLEDANLEGANLSEADLEGATGVTVEELEEQAASLEAATMPDGTEHD
jgi:hypothetical protein